MKKLFAGLLAAALMMFGLVAGSTAPAAAACEPGYPDCPRTTTNLRAPGTIEAGTRAVVRVSAGAPGNVTVRGSITVVADKVRGTGNKSVKVSYKGSTRRVTLPKLSKGKWALTAKFSPRGNFKGSSDRATVRVKR